MKTYPIDSSVLLNIDRKLIEFLKDHTAVLSIAKSALKTHYQLSDGGYSFETTWEAFNSDDRVYEITIAGQMEIDSDKKLTFLSYAFCVSRDGVLLRKYHYDCECSRNGNKPLFHLQYGGKNLTSLSGYNTDYLVSWLSEPRLHYMPTSLVLVLEQAFLEFPDDLTNKIRKDGYWKNLLRNAQKELLVPYFIHCLNKIEKNECIYADCYV